MNKFAFILFLLITEIVAGQADSVQTKSMYAPVIIQSAVYATGTFYLTQIWYAGHRRVSFHFYNDNAGWMQVDKVSHAFISYHVNDISYLIFKSYKYGKKQSLLYSGITTTVFQTTIEVLDGIYEGFGFSWGDMIANTAGIAMFTTQQALWNEQRVILKFSYSPESIADIKPGYENNNQVARIFTDYNGQTYWASLNLKMFFKQSNLPEWLSFAIGYGANGMLKEFENPSYLPYYERYRQFYLSADLDLVALFKTQRKGVKILLRFINTFKFPMPAVEINKFGTTFHWLYF